MMRAWLLVLLLANGLLWAWGAGWLGVRSNGEQREPERLAAQFHPERLKLLDAAQADALRRAPPLCRMLGPFADDPAWQAAEAALRSELNLPNGQWRHEVRDQPAQWGVLSRMAADAGDLERKRALLERANLKPRPVTVPGENNTSLVVARFDSEEAAHTEAERLREAKNLRALRVAELRPPHKLHWLRVTAWPAERLMAKHASWGAGPMACPGVGLGSSSAALSPVAASAPGSAPAAAASAASVASAASAASAP